MALTASVAHTYFALVRRVAGLSLLMLMPLLNAFGQASATDGSTPSGLTRGAPAGSYSLSGFDNVNLYNGNLNASLPLLGVGGRGSAQTTVMLSLNSKGWKVERYFDEWYQANIPDPNWWTGIEPGYGPGVLQGRYAGLQTRQCRRNVYPYDWYPVSKYTYTTLTFTAPDGTEYDLRDQNNLGKPLTSTACNATPGPSRGTVFVSVDGSAATFVSDTTIYDLIDPDPGSGLTPSGFLLLRDGTRYRIDAGTVTWIRDRNGNKLSFAHDANKRMTSITDSLNRQVTFQYDFSDIAPY